MLDCTHCQRPRRFGGVGGQCVAGPFVGAQSSFKLQRLCSKGYAMDNLDETQSIHLSLKLQPYLHGGAVPSLLDATPPPSRSGPKAPGGGGGGGGALEGGFREGRWGGGRSGGSVGGGGPGGAIWGGEGGGGTGSRYLPLASLWGESWG